MTPRELAELAQDAFAGKTRSVLDAINETEKKINSVIAELPESEQKEQLKKLGRKLVMIAIINLSGAKAGMCFLKDALPDLVKHSEKVMLDDLTKKIDLL